MISNKTTVATSTLIVVGGISGGVYYGVYYPNDVLITSLSKDVNYLESVGNAYISYTNMFWTRRENDIKLSSQNDPAKIGYEILEWCANRFKNPRWKETFKSEYFCIQRDTLVKRMGKDYPHITLKSKSDFKDNEDNGYKEIYKGIEDIRDEFSSGEISWLILQGSDEDSEEDEEGDDVNKKEAVYQWCKERTNFLFHDEKFNRYHLMRKHCFKNY